jgi:type IV pilus assembly protein PilW
MRETQVLKADLKGISLLELLIALAISSLVLMGVVTSWLSAKKIFTTQAELIALQDNMRIVNALLKQRIGMSGYAGCRKLSEVALIDHAKFGFSFANSLVGFDAAHCPKYLRSSVIPHTDGIVVQAADGDITELTADAARGSSIIKVVANPATEDNMELLISDCVNAELFVAQNYESGSIKAKTKLAYSYHRSDAEVERVVETAFFVSDTGRTDDRGAPIYALYQVINQGNKQELIPGVAGMSMMYGLADNTGVIKYYSTVQMLAAKAWEKVVSVCITIIYHSPQFGLKAWPIYVKLQER